MGIKFQGVAASFLGEYAEAKSLLAKDTKNPDLKARADQWISWLNTDRSTEPVLNDFFFNAEGVNAKSFPKWENTMHYSFASTVGSSNMEASEGTALWLQAKWHEEQAIALIKEAGKSPEIISLMLEPWRLPFEKQLKRASPSSEIVVGDDWLFFGFL